MLDKMKWAWAALVAFVMAALAFIYGKKTVSVLQAGIKVHNAKGKVLNKEIARAEKAAQAEQDEVEKVHFIERAETLKVDRKKLEEERARLVQETGSRRLSDVDLARIDSARGRKRSSVG